MNELDDFGDADAIFDSFYDAAPTTAEGSASSAIIADDSGNTEADGDGASGASETQGTGTATVTGEKRKASETEADADAVEVGVEEPATKKEKVHPHISFNPSRMSHDDDDDDDVEEVDDDDDDVDDDVDSIASSVDDNDNDNDNDANSTKLQLKVPPPKAVASSLADKTGTGTGTGTGTALSPSKQQPVPLPPSSVVRQPSRPSLMDSDPHHINSHNQDLPQQHASQQQQQQQQQQEQQQTADPSSDTRVSARRADPLQHHNTARPGVTISAAYASGGAPAYSKKSSRPYIPERMAADVPPLLTNHQLIPDLFQTTTPLPLELHSMLDAAQLEQKANATSLTNPSTSASTQSSSIPNPQTFLKTASTSTSTTSKKPNSLVSVAAHIASILTTVETTTGPLPDTLLESVLLPSQPSSWLPTEIEALDKGLELYGKNFTRISRDCVQSHNTFECIHAYYTRKHDLKSVKVKKYKKKVGKEDEEYVKYVGGLSKYINMEGKRMKNEKTGKISMMAALNGNTSSSSSATTTTAATLVNGNEISSSNTNTADTPSSNLSTFSSSNNNSTNNHPVNLYGEPIYREGHEIKGLLGSVKDLSEHGFGANSHFSAANPPNLDKPSNGSSGNNNSTTITVANVIDDGGVGGRTVRTRRAANLKE
ncbi:hypothetical protein HDU99_001582 [Rhizoclosmatium hyalinum]|nr:hypothetical protein HDU99_001582 [Rhizoclosmatium hyalinum]